MDDLAGELRRDRQQAAAAGAALLEYARAWRELLRVPARGVAGALPLPGSAKIPCRSAEAMGASASGIPTAALQAPPPRCHLSCPRGSLSSDR